MAYNSDVWEGRVCQVCEKKRDGMVPARGGLVIDGRKLPSNRVICPDCLKADKERNASVAPSSKITAQKVLGSWWVGKREGREFSGWLNVGSEDGCEQMAKAISAKFADAMEQVKAPCCKDVQCDFCHGRGFEHGADQCDESCNKGGN